MAVTAAQMVTKLRTAIAEFVETGAAVEIEADGARTRFTSLTELEAALRSWERRAVYEARQTGGKSPFRIYRMRPRRPS